MSDYTNGPNVLLKVSVFVSTKTNRSEIFSTTGAPVCVLFSPVHTNWRFHSKTRTFWYVSHYANGAMTRFATPFSKSSAFTLREQWLYLGANRFPTTWENIRISNSVQMVWIKVDKLVFVKSGQQLWVCKTCFDRSSIISDASVPYSANLNEYIAVRILKLLFNVATVLNTNNWIMRAQTVY